VPEDEPVAVVISSASLEYVYSRVSAKASGAAVNPTGDTVAMAFKQGDAEPTAPDFKTASWETDSTTTPPTYYARCLVGPGGAATLADGTWTAWIKVTDSPEIPVRRIGKLTVA
jgi:hypothetical protein